MRSRQQRQPGHIRSGCEFQKQRCQEKGGGVLRQCRESGLHMDMLAGYEFEGKVGVGLKWGLSVFIHANLSVIFTLFPF